jgi:hypothetical protein
MAATDQRPSTTPAPAKPGDGTGRFTYHDADCEQADLEGLLAEKRDFQQAVDAELRGEKPKRPGHSTMP